jgi:hypothetical protein
MSSLSRYGIIATFDLNPVKIRLAKALISDSILEIGVVLQ